jgi:ketosteroid isomerase-like protein
VPELALDSTFAGCRIERIAGRGGMGVVYKATQLPLGRTVALKVVAPERAADPTFYARFERETQVAAAIDHPNVIPVYEAGEYDGRLYLVMRWVPGGDLQQLIVQSAGLDAARAAAIVAQVGSGLEAAHAAGLVHRDVKPANVLMAGGRASGHAYLTDFGLTLDTSASPRLTQTGEWIGTVDFMAPEQFEGGPVDPRTDVYGLGCVLHAALTGRPPFARDTMTATMLAHLRDPPPQPSATPGVPAAFDGVVARALAKRPSDRPSSAAELAEAALAAADSPAGTPTPVATTEAVAHNGGATAILPRTTTALPPAPTAQLSRARGRFRPLALFAAALALALGGGVAALLLTGVEPLASDRASGPLTKGDVRGAVDKFASAYGREDPNALSDVLADDVARVTPGDRQRGRGAVLREYRRQFAANRTQDYALDELDVRGGTVGRASARYTASRAAARPITGRIVFGVQREDGRPKVGLIAATPDS